MAVMNQGFEILLFAILTGYLFFRLWSILGRQDEGHSKNRRQPKAELNNELEDDNVIALPQRQMIREVPKKIEDQFSLSDEVSKGLKTLVGMDHSFDLAHFLLGAKVAFSMIVEAFAKGDRKQLRQLLSDSVYKKFVRALEVRKAENQILETEIVDVRDMTVQSIDVKGKVASITVKFISEQIITTTNADGQIIDNPSRLSVPMIDIWTFSRSLEAEDPNWTLSATRSEKA